MAQFGQQFYRTNKETARKMYDGIEITGKTRVLDPSAGDGALLEMAQTIAEEAYQEKLVGFFEQRTGKNDDDTLDDFLFRNTRHKPSVDACAIEIDPDLQSVLYGKGFTVLDSNFLEYGGEFYFDHIMMNPPFAEGAKHLLHAWDIAHGATIRCLLNAETIDNPYSVDRKRLLNIIERYNGTVERLGQAFSDADRKTDVEVVLVTLADTREREDYTKAYNPDIADIEGDSGVPDFMDKSLVSTEVFATYEANYRAAIAAWKEFILARKKLMHYMTNLLDVSDATRVIKESETDYEKFIRLFIRACWSAVFEKTKLARLTTASVKKQLDEKQDRQGVMAFTAQNMKRLVYSLFGERDRIMTDCVLSAFDHITSGHWDNDEGNKGFKTNSSYQIQSKFILSNVGSDYGISYYRYDMIRDIEKALCFLSGKDYEKINSIIEVFNHRKGIYGKKMQSEFFECKLYMNGNLHFRWLDEDLRERFNQLVGVERFGYMPPKVKKGVYK